MSYKIFENHGHRQALVPTGQGPRVGCDASVCMRLHGLAC